MNKKQLRSKYRALRAKLTPEAIATQSFAIANNALQLPIWDKTYYHLFLPIETKNEVNTQYLLHILQGKDKSMVVSKSNFEDNTLTHFLLQENTRIKVSARGIPEPVSGIAVPVRAIDVVFVPLLTFDGRGNRLGYGRGFYDRFLAQCRPGALFVGLSFFGAERALPNTKNDVPLHRCITPKRVFSF
ncbi:MAG: 5-formyltetrahydrofolate cyclo-ligase [Marinirhabdus sp.]